MAIPMETHGSPWQSMVVGGGGGSPWFLGLRQSMVFRVQAGSATVLCFPAAKTRQNGTFAIQDHLCNRLFVIA